MRDGTCSPAPNSTLVRIGCLLLERNVLRFRHLFGTLVQALFSNKVLDVLVVLVSLDQVPEVVVLLVVVTGTDVVWRGLPVVMKPDDPSGA